MSDFELCEHVLTDWNLETETGTQIGDADFLHAVVIVKLRIEGNKVGLRLGLLSELLVVEAIRVHFHAQIDFPLPALVGFAQPIG